MPRSRASLLELDFLNVLPADPKKYSFNDPTRLARSAQGFLVHALSQLQNLREIRVSTKDTAHWACLSSGQSPSLFSVIFPKFTRLQSLTFPLSQALRNKPLAIADTLVSLSRITLLQDLPSPNIRSLVHPLPNAYFMKLALLKDLRVLGFATPPASIPLTDVITALSSLTRLEELSLWPSCTLDATDALLIEKTFPKLRGLIVPMDSPYNVLCDASLSKVRSLVERGLCFCDIRVVAPSTTSALREFSLLELCSSDSDALLYLLNVMEANFRIRDGLDQPRVRRGLEMGLIMALLSSPADFTDPQRIFRLLSTSHKWSSGVIRKALALWSFADREDVEEELLQFASAEAAVKARRQILGKAPFTPNSEAFLRLIVEACTAERETCPADNVAALELRMKAAAVALTRNRLSGERLCPLLSKLNLMDFYLEAIHIGAELQIPQPLAMGLKGLREIGIDRGMAVNLKRGADGLTPLQRVFAPCKRRVPGAQFSFLVDSVKPLLEVGADVTVLTSDGWNLVDLAVLTRTEHAETEVGRYKTLDLVLQAALKLESSTSAPLFGESDRSRTQLFVLLDEISFYHSPLLSNLEKALSDEVIGSFPYPTRLFDALCRRAGQQQPFCSAAIAFVERWLKMQKTEGKATVDALNAIQRACRSGLLGLLKSVVSITALSLDSIRQEYTWATVVEYFGPSMRSGGPEQDAKDTPAAFLEYLAGAVCPDSSLVKQAILSNTHSILIRSMCTGPRWPTQDRDKSTTQWTLPMDDRDRHPQWRPTMYRVPLFVLAVAGGNAEAFRAISSELDPAFKTSSGESLLHLAPHGAMVELLLVKFRGLDVNALSDKNLTPIQFWAKVYNANALTNLVGALFNNVDGDQKVELGLHGETLTLLPFNPMVADATRRYLLRRTTPAAVSEVIMTALECRHSEWAAHFVTALAEHERLAAMMGSTVVTPEDWRPIVSTVLKNHRSKILSVLAAIPAVKAIIEKQFEPNESNVANTPLMQLVSSSEITADVSACVATLISHFALSMAFYEVRNADGKTALDLLRGASNQKGSHYKPLIQTLEIRTIAFVNPTVPLVSPVAGAPQRLTVPEIGPRSTFGVSGLPPAPVKKPAATPVPTWAPSLASAGIFGASEPKGSGSSSSSSFASPPPGSPTQPSNASPTTSPFGVSVFASPPPISPFDSFSAGAGGSESGSPFKLATSAASTPFAASPSSNPFSAPASSSPGQLSSPSPMNPFAAFETGPAKK